MKKHIIFLIVILMSGCALNGTPPSSTINTTPVITVGESKNVPADHIVFIPANTPFPIKFTVQGTVFNEDVTSAVMASFKQDIYLYKHWASLDGEKWLKSHKLISVKPSGGFDSTGGTVQVELNINEI